MTTLDNLQVFYGQLATTQGCVYARLSDVPSQTDLSLTGRLVGPHCSLSSTLQAHIPFADQGPGPSLLAATLVPDPCFWSPRMPATYEIKIELRCNGTVIDEATRQIGLRMFGARGRDLFLEEKRWVLRGTCAGEDLVAVEAGDLTAWRDHQLAMLADSPNEGLLAAASSQGVMVAARLSEKLSEQVEEVTRLALWPAVSMIVMQQIPCDEVVLRAAAPNLLLAWEASGNELTSRPEWADLLLFPLVEAMRLSRQELAQCPIPVIIYDDDRAAGMSPEAARRQCEQLQREVVALGDFAGYIV